MPDDINDQKGDQRPFNEELARESGVFIEADSGEVAIDTDDAGSPQDDYVADPGERDSGIPGTGDDLPLTFGIETQAPDDEHLVMSGATKRSGHTRENSEAAEDLGKTDESELWREQKSLIEEDEKEGVKLDGFPEEEIPSILDALGDDAADPLQDFPNGTSATGVWTTPEHGGFPERDD